MPGLSHSLPEVTERFSKYHAVTSRSSQGHSKTECCLAAIENKGLPHRMTTIGPRQNANMGLYWCPCYMDQRGLHFNDKGQYINLVIFIFSSYFKQFKRQLTFLPFFNTAWIVGTSVDVQPLNKEYWSYTYIHKCIHGGMFLILDGVGSCNLGGGQGGDGGGAAVWVDQGWACVLATLDQFQTSHWWAQSTWQVLVQLSAKEGQICLR